jgi:hypothetical protein
VCVSVCVSRRGIYVRAIPSQESDSCSIEFLEYTKHRPSFYCIYNIMQHCKDTADFL